MPDIIQDHMVGQKIVQIRRMTAEELAHEGWEGENYDQSDIVIVLENGIKVYPSKDPEGNGPGCLFGYDSRDGEGFYVAIWPQAESVGR